VVPIDVVPCCPAATDTEAGLALTKKSLPVPMRCAQEPLWLLHSCWIQKWPPLNWLLKSEPAAPPIAEPKLKLHLSPFSLPDESNHAVPRGSVIVSLFSWLVTLMVAS